MRVGFVALAVVLAIPATRAPAQFGGLFGKAAGLPEKGIAGGAYQSGNRVRVYISSDPADADTSYARLVTKASEMAGAKGFTRIGVTKDSCSTFLVGGSPRSTSCYVIAKMLHDGELADPRGGDAVQYFDVADVRRGIVAASPN